LHSKLITPLTFKLFSFFPNDYNNQSFISIENFIQAALVIRGLGIRGFDYSRVRKRGKTANIEGNFINLSLKLQFWESNFSGA